MFKSMYSSFIVLFTNHSEMLHDFHVSTFLSHIYKFELRDSQPCLLNRFHIHRCESIVQRMVRMNELIDVSLLPSNVRDIWLPKESEDFMVDEDDYMLVQHNKITGISRPTPICCFSHSLLSYSNFLGPV